MNLTNFKIFGETMGGETSIRSLHISRDHIVAIFETKNGTSIHTTGGFTFNVQEDVSSVREHLYMADSWPERYKEPIYVKRRKPYTTDEYHYVEI